MHVVVYDIVAVEALRRQERQVVPRTYREQAGEEPALTATGSMVNSIIIENDQQYESVEFTPARLEDLSKEEILARIKEGGVVGMGGAGFPTQVKLAPKEPEKIDHILVNGAECEPH